MPEYVIFCHKGSVGEALQKRISGSSLVLLDGEQAVPSPDHYVIHLKSRYRDLFAENLDELYRYDLWVKRQSKKVAGYFDFYEDEFFECEEELAQLVGESWISQEEPWPYATKSNELLDEVRIAEDRLILQMGSHFLTPEARKGLSIDAPEVAPHVVTDNLKDCYGKTALLIDAVLAPGYLEQFIVHVPSGYFHSNMVTIFENFATVREVLRRRFFRPFLTSGAIKLWHISEWESRMAEAYCDPRTSLMTCGFVLARPKHPLVPQVASGCKHCSEHVSNRADESHRELGEYYQSDAFRARLEAIASGEKPKVLIEQACSSVFVKQFSRFTAEELKRQGYDAFIHENCRVDQCDNYVASTIELAQQKPDLLIRSPNSFARSKLQEVPGLPTIYPLQDHGPHMQFPAYVKKFPMSKHSYCIMIEDRFVDAVRTAGAGEDQVFFDYLPTEEPPLDVDSIERTEEFDVGFVKTMSHYLDIAGIMKTCDPEFKGLTNEEAQAMGQVQKVVDDRIYRQGDIPFEDCQQMAMDGLWLNAIVTYAHEQQCVRFMSRVAKEGFSIALTGNNWEKFPELAKYGCGYASDRAEYYQRFYRNKINLSINPWDIYHPRIFEGGRCAAFFLIYKMPDDIAWQQLPEELVQGEHFDYFSSPEECVEKIKYYLERPELRRQIGNNLRKVVEENFTYEVYAKTLMARFTHLVRTHGSEPSRPFSKEPAC